MTADVISAKTQALGWKPINNIKSYIETLRKNDWEG
jgi:UDP-glucose 4-epimerase